MSAGKKIKLVPIHAHVKRSTNVFASLFHQGHEEAFNHFFHLYYPALCFFAARITGDTETAKDLASHAFIKTWAKHEKLQTTTAIKAYLYQVARNDCYKWLQTQKREKALQQNLAAFAAAAEESHLPVLIHAEVVAMLHRHIQQLPVGQQTIFSKLYIEGKTVAETAAELRLSASTVKTQKARGLAVLRSRLAT